ncbi:MAG: hypothetical protein RI949_2808 [Pseudomonadota bacterium]|jgi:uncharacterized protein
MKDAWSLISGLLFGIGLIASGMTDPAKVKGFLDLFGRWDPSLALVMAGGIGVGYFAFAATKNKAVGWTGQPFEVPAATSIDRPLIWGGVLFGVGWGLGGFCPGPAVVALGAGLPQAPIFVAAMLAGMVLHDRFIAPAMTPAVGRTDASCG